MLNRYRLALLAVLAVPVLSGCESFVEDYCIGYPEVLNPIPDVGLIAEAELYVRDLESRPYVFGHTDGQHLYYEAGTSNRRVARAYIDRGVLTVEARNPGRARIQIDAIDECDAYTTSTFIVEVYPYRSNP